MSGFNILFTSQSLMKIDGGNKTLLAMISALVIVSAWTPLAYPAIAERWFSLPNLFYLLPVPVITGLAEKGFMSIEDDGTMFSFAHDKIQQAG